MFKAKEMLMQTAWFWVPILYELYSYVLLIVGGELDSSFSKNLPPLDSYQNPLVYDFEWILSPPHPFNYNLPPPD